ncbi:non-ribosomal peptide synthetase [Amycolatopsis rubida]|uniref:Amino acid adenylation domain-containing protein n=1 Tax=Amycolatopsis rubida TaxID=112413 RepID=A0A1I5UQH3_9PSEU|nr:non-ribosomal peptide synthetase [Amycolatopsis rubida]SFP97511.1 amino acid adenylation domain-containing protein [Amycolatopsis rubida]
MTSTGRPGGPPEPEAIGLHHLVERQAAATPEAIAVTAPDATWTYAELDEQAARIAAGLRERGAGRGRLIGMAIERSAAAVAAILGILKTGAGYVPLDPEFPESRLRFMIEDCLPLVVLHTGAELPSVAGTAMAELDDVLGSPGAREEAAEISPEQTAYVIYTSGSTGRPKGVEIPHRGIVDRVLWERTAYPSGPGDAVILHHALSFDVSLWEIFIPLTTGGRLVVADPLYGQDPRYLTDLVRTENVTCLAVVPALLQALLDEKPGLGGCPSLREVFSGGEVLSPALARRFFATVKAGLHNQYGPTEYSIDTTYWDCEADDPSASVPIGFPRTSARLYILDPQGRPAGEGEAGELHIAGPGLALGYLNRPELTRERFVGNPFDGGRMYRTGDVVRRRDDGALEFVGRADDQVKVRGFRIELGEIERAVEALPEVERAVLTTVGDGDDLALAAFVTPGSVDGRQVRARLAEVLPEYMVPAHVVAQDRLPLGPTGKVDKSALALPAQSARPAGEVPRDPEEELVAGTFAEILGVPEAAAGDDFFELGGNSLQALRLLNILRKNSPELPIAVLFETPTVAGIAAALREVGQTPDPSAVAGP